MAISAKFNIGYRSRYVEDTVGDRSYLRSNPSKVEEVHTGAYHKDIQQRSKAKEIKNKGH